MRNHEGRHDGTHEGCFGCKIKGVQVAPSAMPSRQIDRPFVFRPPPEPSWEKGVAGEHRPGGGFMPILKPGTTTPMGIKEYGENRTKIDAEITETRRPQP